MRSMRLQLFVTMLVLACSGQSWTQAQTPTFLKRLFQPKSSGEIAELQDKHGPWLILAQTFPGEEGRNHATVYGKELEANLKVPVFIMARHLDDDGGGEPSILGQSERIRTDANGQISTKALKAKFANSVPDLSYAVLVGEFQEKDDPRIEKLLKAIRLYRPKAQIPGFQRGTAFLARNPLLPDDYFQSPAVDSFGEDLNRQEWIKHSLLDCPGRFTVRVASFRGADVVSVSGKAKLESDEPTNALDKAASKAHKLTEALRSRRVEAYEYHDRFGSYVTIGSFNDLGREIDGQFQYDPQIIAILNQFCGYEIVTAKDKLTQAEMQTMSVKKEVIQNKSGGKTLIPFDIEGKPIAAPKVQTSKIRGGSIFR